MLYENVSIASFGYELPPDVVTSDDLEKRLEPLYKALHFKKGQLETLTGIKERRFWDPGFPVSEGALLAGRKALDACGLPPAMIQMLIYGGVCRENLEPATACAVADGLGLGSDTLVYDVSNACLGVMNGMVQVANAIELGHIEAGMAESCESARQIVDITIDRLLESLSMDVFKQTVATLTGGSGAVAVVLSRTDQNKPGPKLRGGVYRSAPEHHALCTWGPDTGIPASGLQVMNTDSVGVLQNGVSLGLETYEAFKRELNFRGGAPDKIICHQVGATHQDPLLRSIGIPREKDFTTFQYLGNMGTVSLPITAAMAAERGVLQPGDQVGLLGIGSGLNCLMLALKW